ncbi:hypothetical protein IEQ34_001313 [Dendrobium chrysotoxum]|uniref:Uncharacterized protein n=1 Tax=Dendrobium chrysotoxum TaxID=161865 RepID=A0AAV7H6H5_DENCH|nr:hypothetical protein IEQ34_001313 [Dendrobium chrysotoxum]
MTIAFFSPRRRSCDGSSQEKASMGPVACEGVRRRRAEEGFISFPNLCPHLFSFHILHGLGSLFGRPIQMDNATTIGCSLCNKFLYKVNAMSGSKFEVYNDLPTVGVDAYTKKNCVANMGDEAYEKIDTYFEEKKKLRLAMKAIEQPLSSEPPPMGRLWKLFLSFF